jgi:hypothetical protein
VPLRVEKGRIALELPWDRFGDAVLAALRRGPNSRFLRLLGMQISMLVIITLTETSAKEQADRDSQQVHSWKKQVLNIQMKGHEH